MALLRKFRYDSESKKCVVFIYGGCGGTENRFSTISECVNTCKAQNIKKKPEGDCLLKSQSGSCDDENLRFFFDKSDGSCKEFENGGCGLNKNSYHSKMGCDTDCMVYDYPTKSQ